jgi:hypothetical protein
VNYLFAFHHKGPRFKSPGGYLCETGILLLALYHYIADPDMIDHFCGLVGGGLRPEPSLGPRANNVIIPLDPTQLFCPGFTLTAGPPSFTTNRVSCWGEPCGEPAISLHSHHVSLVQWTMYLFASHHQGPRFKSPGGYLCETGILLLALSCYNINNGRFLALPVNCGQDRTTLSAILLHLELLSPHLETGKRNTFNQ